MPWEDDRPVGYDDSGWHRVLDDGTVTDESESEREKKAAWDDELRDRGTAA